MAESGVSPKILRNRKRWVTDEMRTHFTEVHGHTQVPRDQRQYLLNTDISPIPLKRRKMTKTNGKTHWEIQSFRDRTKATMEQERAEFIAACPTSKSRKKPVSFEQAVIDWDRAVEANGCIMMLEIKYGFDGDHYPCVDNPYPGEITMKNWAEGLPFHDLQDPENHLVEIRQLCEEADKMAGEFVFLDKTEYSCIKTLRDTPEMLQCTNAMIAKLEFGDELYEKLERMCADCPDHLLYGLSDESLAFFCSALSRLPSRPDDYWLAHIFKLY